eukprot:TRINITY_DN1575_c0_g1_i1.p1 TRINITY_DN1575_c0_g1~~TRINITY_DN1575_c0_g1_i1.p1  ORF type:complete len:171 (+),score=57.72 TRINITY_DN1575_c0_g1_i1:40-513(+)
MEFEKRPAKKTMTLEEALDYLQTMFPEIERLVLEEVLRANGNKMQRTIDSLLQISNPTAPPPVPKPTDEAEPPTDPTTSQKESKVEAELQDELYAKALQAQLSRAGDPNDEQIAKELSILQKDEMIARQLQEQEITKSEIQRWRVSGNSKGKITKGL